VLQEVKKSGVDLGSVVAIAGSGQQHGSVYLSSDAAKQIASLCPARGLAEQLTGIFSRPTSPIWMDSSTSVECEEIMAQLGGPRVTAERTGSIAFERFTGPQIRKFWKTSPQEYQETACICLVSSFLASLLAGKLVGVDPGDGAGTNLMDIARRAWLPEALQATAPGLGEKLLPIIPSESVVGSLAPYFVEKFGFRPDTQVVAWSGDNPNSLIGVGLVEAGQIAVSLGTSDTLFGPMADLRTDPQGEGHVFGSPTGDYMSLICFKNGSLARERIKDMFGLDWKTFSSILRSVPPGNGDKILLPYFEPEIVPRILEPGIGRYGLKAEDREGHVRGVVEAQMVSMKIHSEWMGVMPRKIYATGGASKNKDILQVMADVFGVPVFTFELSNSAALGAALRALHAAKKKAGQEIPWTEIASLYAAPDPASAIAPTPQATEVYRKMEKRYKACEAQRLGRS
jgi:xylulokinase